MLGSSAARRYCFGGEAMPKFLALWLCWFNDLEVTFLYQYWQYLYYLYKARWWWMVFRCLGVNLCCRFCGAIAGHWLKPFWNKPGGPFCVFIIPSADWYIWIYSLTILYFKMHRLINLFLPCDILNLMSICYPLWNCSLWAVLFTTGGGICTQCQNMQRGEPSNKKRE